MSGFYRDPEVGFWGAAWEDMSPEHQLIACNDALAPAFSAAEDLAALLDDAHGEGGFEPADMERIAASIKAVIADARRVLGKEPQS